MDMTETERSKVIPESHALIKINGKEIEAYPGTSSSVMYLRLITR